MKAVAGFVAVLLIGVAAWVAAPRSGDRHALLIADSVARPLEDGSAAIALTIRNDGKPDRLITADSPHGTVRLYSPADALGPPVPSGTSSLALDAAHIAFAPDRPLQDGSLIPLMVTFEQAGTVSTRVRVSDPAAVGHASDVGLFGLGDICEVGEGEPAPRIALRVAQTEGGWSVDIDAEDFIFSQDLVGLYHVPGMGHGHLYVGGMKLGRLYAPQASLGALPRGTHEIRVTLNTNDHRAYVLDGTPVTAVATVVVE